MSLDLTVTHALSTNVQPVLDQDGNQSALTIGSDRVGISTTSPDTTLDVHGIIRTWNKDHASATWDNLQLWSEGERSYLLASGANSGLYIEAQDEKQNKTNVLIQPNGGNVGIGTATPRNPLAIRGQGNWEELISFEDPQGNTKWHINQNVAGQNPGLNFVETGVADGRLFIQAGGNVGIGTTNPTGKLQIEGDVIANGTIKASGLEISGPLTISGVNFIISSLPDASTAPVGADLEALVVDKATGKVYMQ